MEFGSIYHRTSDNYCYPLNEYDLIINLKTGYDIKEVYIHYEDPFINGILGGKEKWQSRREKIYYKKRLKNHIWWTTTLKPEFKRCKYYFELVTEDETWFYLEDGFYTKEHIENSKGLMQCFTFPWMNSEDIIKTPKWVNDTVWYQIFPERFCNGDATRNPESVKPWAGFNDKVSNEEFYGGDLQGIIDKIDYLKDLGITGIYLTPINESPSSHKYDTKDYTNIDPHFGNKEVMKNLVRIAHEKGIRVMLDGVFNHCGYEFAPWQDVVEKGPNSKYYNWFMVNKWPFEERGQNARKGNYYSFAFSDNMPKLNTNNKELRDYFLDICEMWVREYDVDGLRLDVANEVSHKFCKELRSRMKEIKDDFYILGEIWHDSIEWLKGDEFDAVMNYPLSGSISDFWLDEELTKEDFEYSINRCYTMYMQQNNDVLFNLLDSHDTERLINRCQNLDKFYQQLAVLFSMPGTVCIFYGTEIALEGAHDPDCRRCMPWGEIEDGKYDDRIEMIKKLISIRKNEPILRSRNFHFTNDLKGDRIVEYIKLDDYNHKIKVILNCSKEDIEIEDEGINLFTNLYEKNILKSNGIIIKRICN